MSIPHPTTDTAGAPTGRSRRIVALDLARGLALIAMATYHFSWDLEYFGYLDAGTVGAGFFKIYARSIAASFLFLAGFSLVLGHYPIVRPRPFLVRLAKIILAAAVITVATYFAFPDGFIFFGILHSIAAASIIGLLFLRLSVVITLICAVAAFVAPFYLRSPLFDTPALWFVGLSQTLPRSNDYVPLFPWLAPFLIGVAAARLFLGSRWPARFAGQAKTLSTWQVALSFASRHSLAFYLLHQPLLFSLVYVFSLIHPAPRPDPVLSFRNNCEMTCMKTESQTLCTAFCACTLDKLQQQSLFEPLDRGEIDVTSDRRVADIANQCTLEAQSKE